MAVQVGHDYVIPAMTTRVIPGLPRNLSGAREVHRQVHLLKFSYLIVNWLTVERCTLKCTSHNICS